MPCTISLEQAQRNSARQKTISERFIHLVRRVRQWSHAGNFEYGKRHRGLRAGLLLLEPASCGPPGGSSVTCARPLLP